MRKNWILDRKFPNFWKKVISNIKIRKIKHIGGKKIWG
jgi:hypothetical protein